MISSTCSSVRLASGGSNVRLLSLHASGGFDSKRQQKFVDSVKNSDIKTLKKVLKKSGIDVNFFMRFEDCGETMAALHYATIHAQLEVVNTLLESKKVAVNLKTPFDESAALHFACGLGNPGSAYALAEALVRAGADVNALEHSKKTPLILCAENGHLGITQLLLQRGACVDHTFCDVDDIPHLAALTIDAVLKRDAVHGNNALVQACRLHHVDIVRVLINRNAYVYTVNKNRSSALHAAADLYFMYKNSLDSTNNTKPNTGDANVVTVLVDRGIDVNARDIMGLRPLQRLLLALHELLSLEARDNVHMACCLTALRMIQLLIRAGASIYASRPLRSTNTHSIIFHKILLAGRVIVKYNNIEVVDEFTKVVKMLVILGCSLHVQDITIATSLGIPQLTAFVVSSFEKPLSLKYLCVATVRKHIRALPVQKNVRKLHTPQVLKQLLCLENL